MAAGIAYILAGSDLKGIGDRIDNAFHARIDAGKKHYPGLDDVRIPDSIPSEIVRYTGFQLSFNKDNHTPNWVAWELLQDETDGSASRNNKFWHDNSVEGCSWTEDYRSSGYDRGHMCPAADQKWSGQAMTDCFSMANMAPQSRKLNSGAWNNLEKRCRMYARRDSAIIIVCGPVYEPSDNERIGNTGVRVPGAFFKVMIAPYLKEPRGIGFVYPNTGAYGNMNNYAMSIDEVEELTGFDFFHNLPDEIETKIESDYSFHLWESQQ